MRNLLSLFQPSFSGALITLEYDERWTAPDSAFCKAVRQWSKKARRILSRQTASRIRNYVEDDEGGDDDFKAGERERESTRNSQVHASIAVYKE